MLEKFIKSYSGTYQYPTMIRHKGVVISFAMDSARRIWYSILELGGNNPPEETNQEPKSPLDVDAWQAAPTELIFPNEIAEVGFGVADQTLLPVFKKNSTDPELVGTILPPGKENEFDYFRSTTARLTARAPFQVLSDGRYVYVFRQAINENDTATMVYVDDSGHTLTIKDDAKGYVEYIEKKKRNIWVDKVIDKDGEPILDKDDNTIPIQGVPLVNSTLLVDRFLLTGTRLTPKMEVRYQRSRSKTRPASRKDSLGAKDLDDNFFYEPTQELRFIGNLPDGQPNEQKGGRFSVLLLPTAIAEIQRWQILAENSETGRMDSYNVERSEDGLFNTRGSQTYTCVDHPQIYARRGGACSECGKTLIPRIVTKGYSESALRFSDTGDSVNIAKSNLLNFEDEITVEAWIKPDKPTQQACFVAKDDKGSVHDYSLGINAEGELSFAATVDGSLVKVTSSFAMLAGTWYHIAGTFDGNAVRIFVNGNKDGENETTGKLSTSAKNLSFARSSSNTASSFAGTIDEVRLWKRARSESEMQADMHQRLTGLESDLAGYWRFDEGSGEIAHDQSNNKVDGKITDAEWVISDAPVGEHPGIERTSFRIKGRTFESPPTSLLYYQQSKAPGGYSGEEKYVKNAGRVMLAVATKDNNPVNAGKNHIAALDFGVSPSGRLAQIPDIIDLPMVASDEVLAEMSANDIVVKLKSETNEATKKGLEQILKKGASVTMPRIQTDRSGLTISGGVLGFAWTQDAPHLFDSATGTLALYFRGGDGQFFVAYYDTFTERASIPLLSNGEEALTCFSTSTAYDKLKVVIEGIEDDPTFTVKAFVGDSEDDFIIKETWEKVPRVIAEFSKVLNGQATGHSYIGSGRKNKSTDWGELILSAPGARRAMNPGTNLMVGDERIEVKEKVFPGDIHIQFTGSITSTEELPVFYVEYDYAENATCEGISTDLSNGSILIRAIPGGDADMEITNTDKLMELAPKMVCRWTAAAPGSTLELDGETSYLVAMDSGKLNDFAAAGDLTMEAWVKPGQFGGEASVIRHHSAGSNYVLGLRRLSTMVFDGVDDYVETPNADQINFGKDQNFTIETWVKVSHQQSDLRGDNNGIIEKWSDTGGYPFVIRYKNRTGKILAARYDTVPENTPVIESNAVVDNGLFHHIAFVKDGAKLKLYIDGNLDNETQDTTQNDTKNVSPLFFGRRGGATSRFFTGAIDEVRIWSRARTEQEIQTFMYRRLSGKEIDLVGYWHFESGVAKDYSNFQNNGMVKGKPELEGVKSALVLDGKNDHVKIPNTDAINFANDQDFTIEAWIKASEWKARSWQGVVVGNDFWLGTSVKQGYALRTGENGKLSFVVAVSMQEGVEWVEAISEGVMEVGTWNHIAGTYDGKVVRIYINGEEKASKEGVGFLSPIRNDNNLNIGRSPKDPERFFAGAIDEVRIWKRARNQQEIQTHINHRLSGNETDLVGYWHFEEGRANDYSSSKNHGEISGQPSVGISPLPTYKAVAGVSDNIVRTKAFFFGDSWNHLAAAYHQAYGLKFDTEDYLDCGNDDTLDINQDLTIEVFLKVETLNRKQVIVRRGRLGDPDPNQNVPYSLWINESNQLVFDFEDVNKDYHDFKSSSLTAGFHKVAVTRKREKNKQEPGSGENVSMKVAAWDKIKFYADGQNWGKGIYGTDIPPTDKNFIQPEDVGNSNKPFYIGNDHNGKATFGGTISEVRVWSNAREQADIGKEITGSEKGLVSWWRFQEGKGNKAFDSKSKNHATINGAEWVKSPDPQGSSLKLYINGQPQTTDKAASAWKTATDQFTLGARKSGEDYDQYLQGELEEVRVWGITRTEEQIQDNLFHRILGEKEDLIVYYTFDAEIENQVSDYSLRGNQLELRGLRSALVFDGVDDHVEIPNSAKINFGKDQNFTVEAWIKASPTQAETGKPDNDIIEKWSGPGGYPFVIRLKRETGIFTAGRHDGDKSSGLQSTQALNDGLFHHMAFAKDGSTLKLYIDGILDAEAEDTITGNSTNRSPLYLGCRGGSSHHFKGAVGEVRIWKRARTLQEIQADMDRRLSGSETDLVGYWHFENGVAKDYSDTKNDGTIKGNPALLSGAIHVLSTAPVGEDTPQVRSALAGIRTPFSGKVESTPAVQEYADMQQDSLGNLIGVFKRCYSYIENGKWQIITGYKVGDMVTEWIGQVQFAPQLIGFIEGAPPVPGENMTAHSADGSGDVGDYNEASVIELVEADETTNVYASSRDTGFDMDVNAKLGLMIGTEANVGFGLVVKSVDVENIVGLQTRFEHSLGWLEDASTTISRSLGKSTRLVLRGHIGFDENVDPEFRNRFIPNNLGQALVKSETADVFALRLKHNGALIAYQMKPNPDIPKDWNIIHFPINPRYTKQGTLDGKIGLETDVDYPNALDYSPDSSYFKPIEAYALKNRINRAETQLRTYFEQYAAGEIGRRQAAVHFTEKDLAAGRMLEKLPHLYKHNLINTYVWTADGGLFSETQETMDSQQEMIGGSYTFKGMAGFYTDLTLALFSTGAKFEGEAMFGGHLNLSVTKTQETTSSFRMNVSLDNIERDIYERDADGKIRIDTSDSKRPMPIKQPGKVDAYRFMSFYLEPLSDHFEDFFNLVVDPIWIEQSDDPAAVALRNARDANQEKKPAPWRIVHRVTYVSRVLPPLDLSAPPSLEKTLQTLDIDSNYELIKQLDPYVRDHLTDFSEFSEEVDKALKKYLPELISHKKEIKQYLSLYYGIDEFMPAPEAEGIGKEPEIEPVRNRPPTVKVGRYPEALELVGSSVTWTPDTKKTSVKDDLLEKPEDLFLTWEFLPVVGQNEQAVVFDNIHILKTTATFTEKGQYRLRLTASDGILSASDETVLVVNQAPVIESLTVKDLKPSEESDSEYIVNLSCTIRTGLGNPSNYETDLDLTWSVVSGSKEHVIGLETDETLTQNEDDPNVVTASKTITIKNRGFYLLKCTVNNGSFSQDSEINLEIAARVTDGLQALYTFEEKDGTSVYDVSGSDTPHNLVISDLTSISWLDGGLALRSPGILSGAANRLTAALRSSNALTLEAWIKPAELDTPGLRRILTLSNGPAARNFILAQSGNTYHVGLRTSDDTVTDFNASLKSLVGGDTDVDQLAHVVFTRDADGNAQLYVDLEPKLESDTQVVDAEPVSKKDSKLSGAEPVSNRIVNGDFSEWDENFQLALGNEFDSEGRSDRAWLGEYHLLAIYDRALSEEEIKQNFNFGADRNLPPQVSAGKDMEINWSIPAIKDGEKWLTDGVSIDDKGRLTLDLHGVVRHDRPTTGSIEWSHVSDHPSVDFDDASDPGTKARCPSSGDYKLRLTATDDIDQVVSKEIMISITHETPVVKIDITDKNLIVTPDHVNTVTLDGAQADLALGGTIENSLGGAYQQDKLTFTWVCEPKNNFIEGTNQLNAKAIFDKNGIYKLTLTATNTDNKELNASNSVYITVNQPPVVDAGPDQTLLLFVGDPSITTQLDGTVSDDGLPEPPGVLKLKWSVLSGDENDVTIMSDEKDFTEVQFKSEGDYTLKLEADDGAVKISDMVKITVKNNGMLPDGGRKAKVVTSGLHVRQDHDADNNKNILYFLKKDDEVTVIDLWPNPETNAVWGRLKPTKKHDQDPQWSAMKVGEDTYLEFIE